MLCRVYYLSGVQVNIHLPVTFCQKSEKLRVKNEDEAVTIGTWHVTPAINLSVFPAKAVRVAVV